MTQNINRHHCTQMCNVTHETAQLTVVSKDKNNTDILQGQLTDGYGEREMAGLIFSPCFCRTPVSQQCSKRGLRLCITCHFFSMKNGRDKQ